MVPVTTMERENITPIIKYMYMPFGVCVCFLKSNRMGLLNRQKQRKENNQGSGNVNEIEISAENKTSESQQKPKEFATSLEKALIFLRGSG